MKEKRYLKKSNKNTALTFSEFLLQINVYTRIETLIIKLALNGLKSDDVIHEFSEFTEEFLEDFIKAIIIWKTLDTISDVQKG
jgi:hypothetical protein